MIHVHVAVANSFKNKQNHILNNVVRSAMSLGPFMLVDISYVPIYAGWWIFTRPEIDGIASPSHSYIPHVTVFNYKY